jgi:hypothetical protein
VFSLTRSGRDRHESVQERTIGALRFGLIPRDTLASAKLDSGIREAMIETIRQLLSSAHLARSEQRLDAAEQVWDGRLACFDFDVLDHIIATSGAPPSGGSSTNPCTGRRVIP